MIWAVLELFQKTWFVLSSLYFKVFFKNTFLKKNNINQIRYIYKYHITTCVVKMCSVVLTVTRLKFFEVFSDRCARSPRCFKIRNHHGARPAESWSRGVWKIELLNGRNQFVQRTSSGHYHFSRGIRKEQSCSIPSGCVSRHKLMASLRLELEESSARWAAGAQGRATRATCVWGTFILEDETQRVKGGNTDVAALPIERRACPCAIEAIFSTQR